MAAANERLVSVISVQVQPAPREDARENVARRCDTLSGFAADANCKINCSHLSPVMGGLPGKPPGVERLTLGTVQQDSGQQQELNLMFRNFSIWHPLKRNCNL